MSAQTGPKWFHALPFAFWPEESEGFCATPQEQWEKERPLRTEYRRRLLGVMFYHDEDTLKKKGIRKDAESLMCRLAIGESENEFSWADVSELFSAWLSEGAQHARAKESFRIQEEEARLAKKYNKKSA